MSDETMELRISNLEEARREQATLNKSIAETLVRIELAVNRAADKGCPKPGLCLELQTLWKSKWENDRERFVKIENRLTENDDWHKDIESSMNEKLDKLRDAHDATKTMLMRATGALGLLVFLMPLLVWAAKAYFTHSP